MSGHIRRARLEERPRITEIRLAVRENQLLDPLRVTDADYQWFSENPGIWVWEESGQILGFLRFESGVQEIFAVQVLPNTHFPEMLEWEDERLAHSYVLPDAALAETPMVDRA